MFCPQCRTSWPKGVSSQSNNGDQASATQRGSAAVCPKCHVPLAADRIQGEFPSVAHFSSLKDGSMTIKDVLRESSIGAVVSGDIPLDDQKDPNRFRVFDTGADGKRVLRRPLTQFSYIGRKPWPRVMLVAATVLFAIIATAALHTTRVLSRQYRAAKANEVLHSNVTAKSVPPLSGFPFDLTRLMPKAIGSWKRAESDPEIAKGIDGANGAEQTFASTYRVGKSHVELWVTTIIGSAASPLAKISQTAMTVHTDQGLIAIPARLDSSGGIQKVAFDYSPSSPKEGFWVQPTETLSMGLPHILTWYKSPYLVTVASANKTDEESFVRQMGAQTN